MKQPYAVSIIDAFSVSREGVKQVLGKRNFRVLDSWSDIANAIEEEVTDAVRAAILMNLTGRPLPTTETLARLREKYPGARLILIGEPFSTSRVQAAVQAGFDGFLLETIDPEAFQKSVELISLGERLFPVSEVVESGHQQERAVPELTVKSLDKLSVGEMRVFALLARACPNKVIARELGISESTVKVHVKAILRKTGARNRTEVALLSRDAEVDGYLEARSDARASGAGATITDPFVTNGNKRSNRRLM